MALETQSPATGPENEPSSIRRLGVFGGTFDPIHIGHLIIAEEARARLGLDHILFVPARISPLKLPGTCFAVEDRVRMVELAVADNPHFGVSRVDVDRQGPSYTVDTLRTLLAEHGQDVRLYFIMGADSLESLDRWHRPGDIIRLTRIVAVSRPGHTIDLQALEARVPDIADVVDIIESVDIGISSTDIRHRLEHGLPVRYQVPDAVEAYIRRHPPRHWPAPVRHGHTNESHANGASGHQRPGHPDPSALCG